MRAEASKPALNPSSGVCQHAPPRILDVHPSLLATSCKFQRPCNSSERVVKNGGYWCPSCAARNCTTSDLSWFWASPAGVHPSFFLAFTSGSNKLVPTKTSRKQDGLKRGTPVNFEQSEADTLRLPGCVFPRQDEEDDEPPAQGNENLPLG